MTPNVIDIYHENNVADFAALKAAGILGVIHKCTQGAGYADPAYAIRRKLALDAGLLWGAYTFNTGEPVAAQIAEFLSHAEPDATTLLALDFEDNPHSQMSLDECRAWLTQFEASQGRKAVLYSGNRVKDLLGGKIDTYLGSHRLWLPQYGPVARVQASWATQWLWQYSETGRLPGTGGAIDLNSYSGDAATLAQEWAS
jgi:lysozyme